MNFLFGGWHCLQANNQDSKRNSNQNILFRMNGTRLLKKILLVLLSVMVLTSACVLSSCSSGKNASIHKAEKDKARKDKQSKKNYDKIVKQHTKNQSAATRSMMKQSKKEIPKNTPMKPSKGKKCK
jgi:hypothetical protein